MSKLVPEERQEVELRGGIGQEAARPCALIVPLGLGPRPATFARLCHARERARASHELL